MKLSALHEIASFDLERYTEKKLRCIVNTKLNSLTFRSDFIRILKWNCVEPRERNTYIIWVGDCSDEEQITLRERANVFLEIYFHSSQLLWRVEGRTLSSGNRCDSLRRNLPETHLWLRNFLMCWKSKATSPYWRNLWESCLWNKKHQKWLPLKSFQWKQIAIFL